MLPGLGRAFREKSGRGVGLPGRHTGIDEAAVGGGGATHGFARGHHFHGGPGADEPGEPHRPAPTGQEAELHFRESEGRRLRPGRHPVIARQGELQPSPQTDPVDDGDRRPGIGREAVVELATGGTGLLDHGGICPEDRLQPIEVGAGKERPRAA